MGEMSVNRDPSRTGHGMAVLRKIGQSRQVFVVTADPSWAKRMSAPADAVIAATPGLADRRCRCVCWAQAIHL